ncbi:hypothetical protein Fcan01_17430 [Folsomia candida]|uniref:Uncharacterized protein n=1 Tax=Folsomia candida TaxID=158441 RepID=A0A226DS47_FOLCA|nr:hypothetical protein Fcan01_17430 [Folsomia candida]
MTISITCPIDDAPKNILPAIDGDEWDSTLNAVYFTAVDSEFNWEADINVIVFISNNKWKCVGDGNPIRGPEYKLPAPDGEATNAPCEQGPVSKNVLYSTLEKRKILLIGLLTPKIYQEYKMFFKDAPHPENFHMLEINGTKGATDKKTAAEKFSRKWYNPEPESYFDQSIRKITFIVDKILKEVPTAKLHLTTFGDYPTVQNHNENSTYCYRYELTISNKETFLTAVKNVNSTYGGRDKYESSLTALLYTATEPKIKWSSKDTKSVVKIIAIASDTLWKSYSNETIGTGPEYGYPEGPIGGYGNCLHRPPITNDVFKTLEKEQFYLIPMIYGDNSRRLWNNTLMSVMRNKYFMENEPVSDPAFDRVRWAINGWANERCTD